jgi:hypothetical protein
MKYMPQNIASFSTGMSQSHGKVQVSRNSQCDIQIQECSQGGSYIVLANSSSKVSVSGENEIREETIQTDMIKLY